MADNGKEAAELIENQRRAGMLRHVKQDKFPKEFLTPGLSFQEALIKGVIRDEKQANAFVLLEQQMREFGMLEELKMVINRLTASAGIYGRARTEALEAHDEIFFPEATIDRKLSKEERSTARDMYLSHTKKTLNTEENHETP